MIERDTIKVGAQLSIAIAAVALLPALWSLGSAIWSATTTDQVLVISIGRTETARALVPWPAGWARFAGPLLLIASLLVYARSKSPQSTIWWVSAALATVGLCLLSFSWWFSSFQRAAGAVVLAAFITTALALGNRFGRLPAYLFVLAAFCTLLCWRLSHGA